MAAHEHLTRQLGLHLGQSSHYPQQLEPALLSPVPRGLARQELGLNEQALPFSGADLWTGYELSWLDGMGKPQVAVGDFSLPCTTPALIESKSFKLFLNSFNQARFDDWQQVQALLEGLKGSGKPLLHTSGSSVVGDDARIGAREDQRRGHADTPGKVRPCARSEASRLRRWAGSGRSTWR